MLPILIDQRTSIGLSVSVRNFVMIFFPSFYLSQATVYDNKIQTKQKSRLCVIFVILIFYIDMHRHECNILKIIGGHSGVIMPKEFSIYSEIISHHDCSTI